MHIQYLYSIISLSLDILQFLSRCHTTLTVESQVFAIVVHCVVDLKQCVWLRSVTFSVRRAQTQTRTHT